MTQLAEKLKVRKSCKNNKLKNDNKGSTQIIGTMADHLQNICAARERGKETDRMAKGKRRVQRKNDNK